MSSEPGAGHYGTNYVKNYDKKIGDGIAEIMALEAKIASMIRDAGAPMLQEARAIFLALMFADQDVIATSPKYRGRKTSVRLPMLHAYVEMRRQMLEIVLDEVTGYQIQLRTWGRRSKRGG